MEKHENPLERQHANKGKAFSFSVVLIFVVEYNKALLIPNSFYSTSSSPQFSFFFEFNPQSFSITLYCADICLYICRLNKKKRSTFRTFHVEWSVTELRERKSMEMWKEKRRLGGLVENENKIKRIKNKKIRENVFRWIFCAVICSTHTISIYTYTYVYIYNTFAAVNSIWIFHVSESTLLTWWWRRRIQQKSEWTYPQ